MRTVRRIPRGVATQIQELRALAVRSRKQTGPGLVLGPVCCVHYRLHDADTAHRALLTADITRFLERPYTPDQRVPDLDIPPGQPIGDMDWEW